MALDFSVLQGMDPAGAFFRGQEAVRAEADRNLLRQAQMEQMAAQRENMLAQREDRNALRRTQEAEEARRREMFELDRQLKTVDLASKSLFAATPQTYPAVRDYLTRVNPQFGASLPQEYDEATVKAIAKQGMGLKDQVEAAMGRSRYMSTPYGPFDIETGQFRLPEALPSRAPSAAAAPAAAAPKPPAGYRFTEGGNLEPIPGGPAARRVGVGPAGAKPPAEPKPATVTEQQASTATQRLLNRAQEISKVLAANKKAEAPTVVEAAMENVPLLSRATNLVRSTDRQIVSSAQDDILDALLYLSTGAAYNKEQLAQQKSAYLPSWSDDPDTREVKRRRLVQAIEGARVRAGRAWTPELDAAMQQLVASPVMGSRAGGPQRPAAAPAAGANPYQSLSNDELLKQLGVKPGGR